MNGITSGSADVLWAIGGAGLDPRALSATLMTDPEAAVPPFVVGESDPSVDWPPVQPGPLDALMGWRPHAVTVEFSLATQDVADDLAFYATEDVSIELCGAAW